MVNPGDNVPNTLKAEFGEEALNSLEATEEEKKQISAWIDQLFTQGETVSLRLGIYSSFAFTVDHRIFRFHHGSRQ